MASSLPKIPVPLPTQGIRADINDFHLPPDAARETTYNWIFRDGEIITRPGLNDIANVSEANPVGIISYFHATFGQIVVHATRTRWWLYDLGSDAWVDISDPALLWAAASNQVAFRVFNSGGTVFLLGVNGFESPRAWSTNPGGVFTLFGGSAPVATCIAIVADRVLLGLLSDQQAVDVSAFQDHTSGWGVTQTAVLVDTPGFIISMNELGANQAAIYKSDAVYLASGTTGLAPIRFDLHSANIPGPAGLGAVVPLSSRLHAIFTSDGEVFLFDGVTYAQHPASDQVRTLVQSSISKLLSSTAQIHGFYDDVHNELWWFYPRIGLEPNGPRDAVMINLTNNSVWKIDYDSPALSFRTSYFGNWLEAAGSRNVAFLGDSTGQFYLIETDTDDSTAIIAQLDTGLSHLGDPTLYKTLLETEHRFASTNTDQSVDFSVLTSEGGEDPVTHPAKTLTVTAAGTGPYTTGHRDVNDESITSRLYGLRIKGSALTAPLEYHGSSITFAPRGFR